MYHIVHDAALHFVPRELFQSRLWVPQQVREVGDKLARGSEGEFRFGVSAQLLLGDLDGRGPVGEAEGAGDVDFGVT